MRIVFWAGRRGAEEAGPIWRYPDAADSRSARSQGRPHERQCPGRGQVSPADASGPSGRQSMAGTFPPRRFNVFQQTLTADYPARGVAIKGPQTGLNRKAEEAGKSIRVIRLFPLSPIFLFDKQDSWGLGNRCADIKPRSRTVAFTVSAEAVAKADPRHLRHPRLKRLGPHRPRLRP
jgi:hypothetical protein